MINTDMKFDDLVQQLMETHKESHDVTINKVLEIDLDFEQEPINNLLPDDQYYGRAIIEITDPQGETYPVRVIHDPAESGDKGGELFFYYEEPWNLKQKRDSSVFDMAYKWFHGDVLNKVHALFTKEAYDKFKYSQQVRSHLQDDDDDLGFGDLDI